MQLLDFFSNYVSPRCIHGDSSFCYPIVVYIFNTEKISNAV